MTPLGSAKVQGADTTCSSLVYTVTPFSPWRTIRLLQSFSLISNLAASDESLQAIRFAIKSNPRVWKITQSAPAVRCSPVNFGSQITGTSATLAALISRAAPSSVTTPCP